jgi:hypothetical protein
MTIGTKHVGILAVGPEIHLAGLIDSKLIPPDAASVQRTANAQRPGIDFEAGVAAPSLQQPTFSSC